MIHGVLRRIFGEPKKEDEASFELFDIIDFTIKLPEEKALYYQETTKEDLNYMNSLTEAAILDQLVNEANKMNGPYYIFDIDGTLFDHSERLARLKDAKDLNIPEAWDDFYRDIHLDADIDSMQGICEDLSMFCDILFITGRREESREDTIRQIQSSIELPDSCKWKLHMRPEGDFRPEADLKKDVAMHYLEEGSVIIMAFDDDPACVQMYQDLGIDCLRPNMVRTDAEVQEKWTWKNTQL